MFGLRVCVHVWAQNAFQPFFFLLSAIKADFFNREQCICELFTDSQISLFINFFIKNESHDTIHTFKNYFATVFFNFQFSVVSKWTLKIFNLEMIVGRIKSFTWPILVPFSFLAWVIFLDLLSHLTELISKICISSSRAFDNNYLPI